MESIVYNKTNYGCVVVASSLPEEYDLESKKINLTAGGCLYNSYQIAKLFDNVKIVEGFLKTEFENGDIECVAHVWNCIDDNYFDATISIKKHDKDIKQNLYYFAESYEVKESKIVDANVVTNFNFFFEPKEKKLIFKSQVKIIENDVLKYLKVKSGKDNELDDSAIK